MLARGCIELPLCGNFQEFSVCVSVGHGIVSGNDRCPTPPPPHLCSYHVSSIVGLWTVFALHASVCLCVCSVVGRWPASAVEAPQGTYLGRRRGRMVAAHGWCVAAAARGVTPVRSAMAGQHAQRCRRPNGAGPRRWLSMSHARDQWGVGQSAAANAHPAPVRGT